MGNITYYISLIIRTIDFKIMIQKTIREISDAWREDKRPYVKQSTMAAYIREFGITYYPQMVN